LNNEDKNIKAIIPKDKVLGYFGRDKKTRRITVHMLVAYKAYCQGIKPKEISKRLKIPERTIYDWIKVFEQKMPPGIQIEKLVDADFDPEEEMKSLRQMAISTYRWNIILGDRDSARHILEQTNVFRKRTDSEILESRTMTDEELIRVFIQNVFRTKDDGLINTLAETIRECYKEFREEASATKELRDKLSLAGQDNTGEAPVVGTD